MLAASIDSRFKASAVHLALSALLLVVLLIVIFNFWFPHHLIFAGGIAGLKILLAVDLILGPGLTLIVFDRHKPSLKFDLAVIALIQLSCLAGGMWVIYNERPVAQVMADDGIHLMTATDLKQYKTELNHLPEAAPRLFLLDLPENTSQIAMLKDATGIVQNKPFSFRSDLYIPLTTVDNQAYRNRLNFILSNVSSEMAAEMAELAPAEKCQWLPLTSKHYQGYTCFSRTKGATWLNPSELMGINKAKMDEMIEKARTKRSD